MPALQRGPLGPKLTSHDNDDVDDVDDDAAAANSLLPDDVDWLLQCSAHVIP